MTREFDHVRAAFARSMAGRLVSAWNDAIDRAWRSSAARRATRSLRNHDAARSTRAIALAMAVALIVQPLLNALMPRTVAPAMPWWAYGLLALLAGSVAAQSEAVAAAWPSSRLRRWLNLSRRSA